MWIGCEKAVINVQIIEREIKIEKILHDVGGCLSLAKDGTSLQMKMVILATTLMGCN